MKVISLILAIAALAAMLCTGEGTMRLILRHIRLLAVAFVEVLMGKDKQ